MAEPDNERQYHERADSTVANHLKNGKAGHQNPKDGTEPKNTRADSFCGFGDRLFVDHENLSVDVSELYHTNS